LGEVLDSGPYDRRRFKRFGGYSGVSKSAQYGELTGTAALLQASRKACLIANREFLITKKNFFKRRLSRQDIVAQARSYAGGGTRSNWRQCQNDAGGGGKKYQKPRQANWRWREMHEPKKKGGGGGGGGGGVIALRAGAGSERGEKVENNE